MSEIKYEIVKQIGVLFKSSSGWVKVNALRELPYPPFGLLRDPQIRRPNGRMHMSNFYRRICPLALLRGCSAREGWGGAC